MATSKRSKQIKKKRKWFNVFAPEVYEKKELEPILAAEPKNLIGRTIRINFGQITDNPKDQQKKAVLKIRDVKGETAETDIVSYFIMDNYLQRALKRFLEQFFTVFTVGLKDGKKMKIKISFGGKTRMYRSQKTDIIRIVKEICKSDFENQTSATAFNLSYLRETEAKLRKSAKSVYPIEHIKIWKAELIK